MSNTATGNDKLVGLQILRAIAALMVVFHHARLSVPGSGFVSSAGETGVDIFFVISGYVMAYTTKAMQRGDGRLARFAAARDFLLNRILRVVPLYWLALAWTAHRGYGTRFHASDIALDMLFIPHLSTEFSWSIFPIVVQGWTLNYEMFFYLLFALSLTFGVMSRRVLIGFILLLTVAGFVQTLQQVGIPAIDDTQRMFTAKRDLSLVLAYFYTNNIMLEFCFGVALEGLTRRKGLPTWPRWCFALLMLVGLASLLFAHLHWPRGLMQGLPAALVVWASVPTFRGLRARILEALGNASYSIYLFHWAAFATLKPLMNAERSSTSSPAGILLLLSAHVVVAAALGIAVHVFIEKPLTRFLKAHFGRRASTNPLAAASP